MASHQYFGKVKPEGGSRRNFNLKPGDNVFRILPPFKSLAAKGQLSAYHRQHFGYAGNDKKNPGKTKQRPFRCIKEQDFDTKMVRVRCPECDKIEEVTQLLDNRFAELRAKGTSADQVETLVAPLKKFLKEHNSDGKHYYNVKNANGEFGVLAVGATAHKALRAAIKDLMEKDKIDAIDPDQGVLFNFHRSGEGLKTEYRVEVVTETVIENGRRLKSIKIAPLSQEDLERAVDDCQDLSMIGTRLTADQIRMLINASDADEVDSIFNLAQKRETSPSAESSPAVTSSMPAHSVPAISQIDDVAALKARLAQLEAQQSAAAVTPAVSTPTPATVAPAATPTVDPTAMTDADFLAMFKGKMK